MPEIHETITSMTAVFTPAPECLSQWTYEPSEFNLMPDGMIRQNIYSQNDFYYSCYPPGVTTQFLTMSDSWRVQTFSPGVCPVGYSTDWKTEFSGTHVARCCFSSFKFTIDSVTRAVFSVSFGGCVSTWSGTTSMLACVGSPFMSTTDLALTVLSAPVRMWAMPIFIAWQDKELSLFSSTVLLPPTPVSADTTTKSPEETVTTSEHHTATLTLVSKTSLSNTRGSSSHSLSISASRSQDFTQHSSGFGPSGTNSGTRYVSDASTTSMSRSHIAGICVGGLTALAVLAGILFIFFRIRRRKQQARHCETEIEPQEEEPQSIIHELDAGSEPLEQYKPYRKPVYMSEVEAMSKSRLSTVNSPTITRLGKECDNRS